MNNTISQYIYNKKNIHDKNRQAIGVLAATTKESSKTVHIGWSLCAKNRGDKFDKERGLRIAIGRSLAGSKVEVPDSIVEDINYFSVRVCRYFKDKEISTENLPIPDKKVDSSPKVSLHIEVER